MFLQLSVHILAAYVVRYTPISAFARCPLSNNMSKLNDGKQALVVRSNTADSTTIPITQQHGSLSRISLVCIYLLSRTRRDPLALSPSIPPTLSCSDQPAYSAQPTAIATSCDNCVARDRLSSR